MARLSDAEPHYRRSIELRPRFALAYSNLASVLRFLGRAEDGDALYRKALEIEPREPAAGYALSSGRLMALHYRADASAETILEEHRRWGDALMARQGAAASEFPNIADPDRPLRVGYVSPDFRQHSVIHFLEPLLAHHDRETFEVTCYAEITEPDAVTQRFQALARRWRFTAGVSDADVRRQVREDQIDIMIDLAGHTGSSRITVFAVKPAPVTATWLGYPGSTGLATVDYRITDERADPLGVTERHHTEELVRLPDGFLCYRPPPDTTPVRPTPALNKGFVTFGSFNYPEKVMPKVVETWAAILREVPGSRLLLKGWHFGDPAIRQRYLDGFGSVGVGPERIDLRPMIPGMIEHLRLYDEVDIALDPFPYNGTTTTCEALWMGVPVVTLVGDRHAARVGLSLLWQIGLTELAALDPAAYIRIAADLACDAERLNKLRLGLRDRMRDSPLMDEPRFARSFEGALRMMWRAWCAAKVGPGCQHGVHE
jgi:predicted O-linked N-acetylglucosamine transferase (SPINDLY family)